MGIWRIIPFNRYAHAVKIRIFRELRSFDGHVHFVASQDALNEFYEPVLCIRRNDDFVEDVRQLNGNWHPGNSIWLHIHTPFAFSVLVVLMIRYVVNQSPNFVLVLKTEALQHRKMLGYRLLNDLCIIVNIAYSPYLHMWKSAEP